jgi:hypothetical protein
MEKSEKKRLRAEENALMVTAKIAFLAGAADQKKSGEETDRVWFPGADEPGGPTYDYHYAQKLQSREEG